MRELTIKKRKISDNSKPFVVAEIGHNHGGDLRTCKKMFEVAKECGVDAVKLQKRNNKTLFTETFYNTPYNSEGAYGATYGLHREALELGKEEYEELKRHADKLGLIFFATAFDFDSADFLHKLNMPCFKMASGDITNTPLLRYVAKKGKPMIISTGAATMEDVERAHKAVYPINHKMAFLQCTTTYPTEPGLMNLKVISAYRKQFPNTVIGLSDHYNGVALPVAAYALGARIFEKHFTLSRALRGTDHAFSLEPVGMKKLVRDLQRTYLAMGDGIKKIYPDELPARTKMAKKIVLAKDLPAGHKIRLADLAFKSPGDGLPPYLAEKICGKTLKIALQKDEAIKFEHI